MFGLATFLRCVPCPLPSALLAPLAMQGTMSHLARIVLTVAVASVASAAVIRVSCVGDSITAGTCSKSGKTLFSTQTAVQALHARPSTPLGVLQSWALHAVCHWTFPRAHLPMPRFARTLTLPAMMCAVFVCSFCCRFVCPVYMPVRAPPPRSSLSHSPLLVPPPPHTHTPLSIFFLSSNRWLSTQASGNSVLWK